MECELMKTFPNRPALFLNVKVLTDWQQNLKIGKSSTEKKKSDSQAYVLSFMCAT